MWTFAQQTLIDGGRRSWCGRVMVRGQVGTHAMIRHVCQVVNCSDVGGGGTWCAYDVEIDHGAGVLALTQLPQIEPTHEAREAH